MRNVALKESVLMRALTAWVHMQAFNQSNYFNNNNKKVILHVNEILSSQLICEKWCFYLHINVTRVILYFLYYMIF